MTEENQTLTTNEAINEFYRLKDKYETGYNEKYVKPIVKSKKPNKEKRVEYSRLPKPECINCKRNVGTIFTIKSDKKEDVRKFIAKCGDLTDPCPLDIQINYSMRDQLYNTIISGSNFIEGLKLEIIQEKNNALFFNKNVIQIFEEVTADLKTHTESVGFAIETNILRNDNPEKQALIKKNIDEFGKGFILPFKQMISDYMDTTDELVINQAVKFYVDEMLPKLKEIQEMKYSVNFVEYDPEDDTYKLILYANSLENSEFFVKSDDKVVKFIKGVRKDKKSKTMKNFAEEVSLKNKTRKIRPTADLVIEDEELEEYDGATETKEGQKTVVKTAIIIPFRDLEPEKPRTKQLDEFIKYMADYLKDINYKIFVVEQTDDSNKFNRGQLLNIGFKFAENEGYNNFIFHDVDLLPSAELKKYYTEVPEKNPVHIAAVWDRYGKNPDYFGGIVAFNKEMFNRINGFPNNFWGWGGEDDELYKRTIPYYTISKAKKGSIRDLEDMNLQEKLGYLKENDLKFMQKREALAEHEKTWRYNGLNNITRLSDFEENYTSCGTNCERILVKLKNFSEISPDIPAYEEDKPIWNKKEYDEVWGRVPSKLKEYLNMDKQWLEDYMHACINAKNKGKPCELFLPKQTKFPPEVLEDGKYDFNSEVVNKLFNSLEKSYQKTLLTLYSDKNGVKDYSMLKDTLASLLTGNVNNYNRGYF
jgi:hypothetical protein